MVFSHKTRKLFGVFLSIAFIGSLVFIGLNRNLISVHASNFNGSAIGSGLLAKSMGNVSAVAYAVTSASVDVRISSGADDVEQKISSGRMIFDSKGLDMTYDPLVAQGNQGIGLRFTGVSIPRGATITRAYIEFTINQTTSDATSLVFNGQAVDSAPKFTSGSYNLTRRAKTAAAVNWNNIPAWTTIGTRIQTPDLSPIVQEIVKRSGWSSGNSMVILVNGTGRRVAGAYESGSQNAALLHVEYSLTSSIPTSTSTSIATTPAPTATTTPIATTPAPTSTATPVATTPAPAQPMPVGVAGSWKLVFADEFNGTSLDSTKWRTCFWWADTTCSIETNKELELYNPQDVLVQNGILRLRAQKRDMVAWNGTTYHYTSGMVMSGGRSGSIPPEFAYTYGYAEALVKVPAGKGLWPAFWMLPSDYTTRPEIDIMEVLADKTNVDNMNYHYIGGDAGTAWTGPDFSAGWHVIGLDWEPAAIVWYVDGVEVWRYTDTATISAKPSYLLLDLAVGGTWPGSPDSTTPFPSYFDIDYVRVWQK